MILSTDAASCWLWVVGMGQINFNHLDKLKASRRDAKRVVAFLPTGWTHTSTSGAPKQSNNRSNAGSVSKGLGKKPMANSAEGDDFVSERCEEEEDDNTLNRSLEVNASARSGMGENRATGRLVLKAKRKENCVIYSVPYSEHSSFGELVDFIKVFRQVIPCSKN
jgi:hypothetical protein